MRIISLTLLCASIATLYACAPRHQPDRELHNAYQKLQAQHETLLARHNNLLKQQERVIARMDALDKAACPPSFTRIGQTDDGLPLCIKTITDTNVAQKTPNPPVLFSAIPETRTLAPLVWSDDARAFPRTTIRKKPPSKRAPGTSPELFDPQLRDNMQRPTQPAPAQFKRPKLPNGYFE